MFNDEKFAKLLQKLAEDVIKDLDKAKLVSELTKDLPEVLKNCVLHELGMQYDRWDRKHKFNEHGSRGKIRKLVDEWASEKALQLLSEVDLASIELSKSDRKAIVKCYTSERRRLLEGHAQQMARDDFQAFIDGNLRDIKASISQKSSTKKKHQDEVLDAIFGSEQQEEE